MSFNISIKGLFVQKRDIIHFNISIKKSICTEA
jgi:hypothetical protein